MIFPQFMSLDVGSTSEGKTESTTAGTLSCSENKTTLAYKYPMVSRKIRLSVRLAIA